MRQSIFIPIVFALLVSLAITCDSLAAKKSRPPEYPPSYEVPQCFMEELKKGDLDSAAGALLDATKNIKTDFLLGQTTKIIRFRNSGKPPRSSARKTYLNAAICYHNLYFFLLSQGIESEEFFKKAKKLYRKGCRSSSKLLSDQCRILRASLYASSGRIKKARRMTKRIRGDFLAGDFEALEYMAALQASIGNVDGAIEYIQQAYQVEPDRMVAWLLIGDDFYNVQNDMKFQTFVNKLFRNSRDTMITLSVPRKRPARLTIEDPTVIFNNRMPKYKKRWR